MRLEITLNTKSRMFSIPINYNYPLSLEFKRIFANSANDFSYWMYPDVCRFAESKSAKLFTFSKIMNPKLKIDNYYISGHGESKVILSAPVDDEFVESFIKAFIGTRRILLNNRVSGNEFFISNVRVIPDPEFDFKEKYIMLAPTTISKINLLGGHKNIHFLRVSDNDIENALAFNLRKKFKSIYSFDYEGALDIKLDQEYIRTRGGAESVSKLITIKEGQYDELRIKGFICPISITADPIMQKVAYDCGLGERNTLGMGMIDKIKYNQ